MQDQSAGGTATANGRLAIRSVERIEIPVSGMTCAACQSYVQRTLIADPGVVDASVNLMLHNASVTFDPLVTNPTALIDTIRGAGYGAELPKSDQSIVDEQEQHDLEQLREYHDLRRKAIVSLIAGVVAMIVSMPLMSVPAGGLQHVTDPLIGWSMRSIDPALRRMMPWMFLIDGSWIQWFLLILSALIAGWAGRRFYTKAWSALRHKTADMNTLIALGTGSAFLYSAASTIAPGFFIGHGIAPDVYYEAGILIIAMVLIGNTLESRAKEDTASALQKLVRLQPKTARVLRGATEYNMPVDAIQADDVIVVRPGERIPDGWENRCGQQQRR